MKKTNNAKVMLNAYPDSLGGTLSDIADFLGSSELQDVFGSFYVLPSVFNTDLDRGFSVIDYDLNDLLAKREDLNYIRGLGVDFKFDFILNHGSVLSPQFQDLLKNGEESLYRDFFINWNSFWKGYGQMTDGGYIQPDDKYIKDMFFRKPGLPILMVRMPDGSQVPYWNTFYQEVRYKRLDPQKTMKLTGLQYLSAECLSERINWSLDLGIHPENADWEGYEKYRAPIVSYLEASKCYLGQMDLNIKSSLVWEFYEETLNKLSDYGASVIRLDAFAYAPKEPGEKNFLNDAGTWDLLERVKMLADPLNLSLLPEIHSRYEEKTHEIIAGKGYMTYDFFLPGLVIDAFENRSKEILEKWIHQLVDKKIRTVNMLGCHDGIPLLDLKGLLDEDRIQNLIDTLVARGGYIKDLHGQKNVYYQVNATFYSALGEKDERLLLSRAIQLFMPGKPQIWYLDLFAGKNDYEAVKKAGTGGHKEINRTNLTKEDIQFGLSRKVVQDQLTLLRFRNTFEAFGFESEMSMFKTESSNMIHWTWMNNGYRASLEADLITSSFSVQGFDPRGGRTFHYCLK